VFFRPSSTPLSAEAQACAKSLFDAVEALLPADAQNLFGQWSIADVDLALMLNRLVLDGTEMPQRQRPSVQRWVKLAR